MEKIIEIKTAATNGVKKLCCRFWQIRAFKANGEMRMSCHVFISAKHSETNSEQAKKNDSSEKKVMKNKVMIQVL
jgi:hypothetical protein